LVIGIVWLFYFGWLVPGVTGSLGIGPIPDIYYPGS